MERDYKLKTAILLLPSRLILFLIFQLSFALLFSSLEYSIKFWIVYASATNIISISLLFYLFRTDGIQFFDLFRFDKATLKKDIMHFAGITLICVPVVIFPNYFLSTSLWGDAIIPFDMMFKPLPLLLVYLLLFLFPITIAFAELATYFGSGLSKISKIE
ncbi:MAG TPA: hypothetical protein VMV47_03320 [Bacteroidales bacterium]|nr:hypothetical protein [Bacteroidales bacterium]